jgi:hypothetical protein
MPQVRTEIRDALIAELHIFLQSFLDDPFQFRETFWIQLDWWGWNLVESRIKYGRRGCPRMPDCLSPSRKARLLEKTGPSGG